MVMSEGVVSFNKYQKYKIASMKCYSKKLIIQCYFANNTELSSKFKVFKLFVIKNYN